MSFNIGVLGTGDVGKELAAGLAKKGHHVVIGTRDPSAEKIGPLLDYVGHGVVAKTFKEVVEHVDVVIFVMEGGSVEHVVHQATVAAFSKKVVIDATNPLGGIVDGHLTLIVGHSDSGGERLQRLIPSANVVKCFNIIGVNLMIDPSDFYGGVKPDMWICGDDEEAKRTVSRILNSLGWNSECVIDCGLIQMSRVLEPVCLMWCHYAFTTRTRTHALKLLRTFPTLQPPAPVKIISQYIAPSSVSSAKIAVLGTGEVGVTLAKGFISKGHSVTIGTRDPTSEKSIALTASIGGTIKIASFADAAKESDIIFLVTAGPAAIPVLESIGEEALRGKLLLDAVNPISGLQGTMLQFFLGHNDSMGEQVQRAAPSARVVKCFNMIGNGLMIDPHTFNGVKPDMFIAGDDPRAKEETTDLLGELGWSGDCVVDFGKISSARFLEPLCQLWCQYGFATKTWDHAFKLLRQ